MAQSGKSHTVLLLPPSSCRACATVQQSKADAAVPKAPASVGDLAGFPCRHSGPWGGGTRGGSRFPPQEAEESGQAHAGGCGRNCEMLRVLQSLVESQGDGGGPLLVRGVRLDEQSASLIGSMPCQLFLRPFFFFCLLQRPKAPETVAETAAAGAFRPTGGTKALWGGGGGAS